MRPPRFEEPSQIETLGYIVSISLLLGILITVLIWLNVPAQVVNLLFWFSLGAVGLSALLLFRWQRSAHPRWVRLLAVLAAVSLVYLFPEIFRPGCGDTPRAFAQDACRVCTRHENYWDFYGNQKSRCVEWIDICTDPVIEATLQCTQWGSNNWCRGGLSLGLIANESQGRELLISGDVDGTVFACPAGVGPVSCSLPLPEGTGTVNYSATSSIGRSVSGSITYRRDSLGPQIDGWLDGTPGNVPWFVSPVDVNASASDPGPGSGLAGFEYSLDGVNWSNFPGTLSLSDGVHSLSLRASDGAGNLVETSQVIQVDTITPALDLSLSGIAGANGWYVSVVELAATAIDAGSGPAALEASLDGGAWEAFTAPLLFSDGGHSFRFRAFDHSGNLTETPLQALSVDTIPPSITLPASWALGRAVTFDLYDGGSGLAGVRLVIEDEDERYPKVAWYDDLAGEKFWGEIAWDGRFKDGSRALPGGEYHAWLKVADNAGNESMQAGQIFVEADLPPATNAPGAMVTLTEVDVSNEPEAGVPNSSSSPPVGVPSVGSFGGGNNDIRPSDTQTGKKSFNAGPPTTSQAPDFQSNVLWGASATAAIGAFAAEIARRKQVEIENLAAIYAARQEKRESSNYLQKVNAEKVAKLEKEWAAERALAEQREKELRQDIQTSKEKLLEFEIPEVKPAYVPAVAGWKERDYAQLDHAQEVANQKNWWENTKSFIGNNIIQPLNTYVFQPYIKPATEYIFEAFTNGALWVNENVYQPHVQPALEKAKQTITNNIAWAIENIYQPYVKPITEKAVQTVTDGIAWANENIYQPHVKPAIEKAIQAISDGIAWANESIYQPYVKPAVEKAIQTATDGIAWANENIYQPYIEPVLTSIDEKFYQPYVLPLLNETMGAVAIGASWINKNIYQPVFQPVVADIDKYIYQPYLKLEDKASAWWDETWEEYGEWVHGSLDTVGFVPGVGEVADGLNGLVYLAEGRYLEAAISAAAMIPILGDLGKAGKWTVKVGMEVLEEAGEKVAKEILEEAIEKAAKETFEEAIQETAEKTLKETGEKLVNKVAKETVEEVTDKALRETGEELALKTVKEASEKATKDISEEVVTKTVKETVAATPAIPTQKVSKTVVEQTGSETLEQANKQTVQLISSLTEVHGSVVLDIVRKHGDDAIDLIKDFGTPAIKTLEAVDPDSAKKLLKNLDDDVLEYALAQGSEALDALSRWSDKDLAEYGLDLAMRAKKDAEVLKDVKKLIALGPIDPAHLTREQQDLINAIAANSTQYSDEGQVLLGKWVDYGNGFTEYARKTGSAHYNPHPDMWKLLGELGEENRDNVAWLINEQVIQTGVVKGLPFEYTLEGVPVDDIFTEQNAVQLIFSGASDSEMKSVLRVNKLAIRWQELRELQKAGYEFIFDEMNNSFILSLP